MTYTDRQPVVTMRPAPSIAVINLTGMVGSAFDDRYTVQVDAAAQYTDRPGQWLVQVTLYGRKHGKFATLVVNAGTGVVSSGAYWDDPKQADHSFMARCYGARA